MGRINKLVAAVVVFVFIPAVGINAQEVDTPRKVVPLKDRIKSVQQKVFLKKGRFEFGPLFGFGLNDNYVHNFQLGAILAYHITEQWAIEAGGGYTLHKVKGWIDDVENVYNMQIFPHIAYKEYALNVGATWSPIYGKWSILDDFIIHLDMYLLAGFSGLGVDGSFKPGGQVGVGMSIFTTRWLSLRLEYRDTMYGQDGFANHMLFFVGAGFWVPFDFHYTTGVKTIRRTARQEQPAKKKKKKEEKKEEKKKEENEPSLDDIQLELGE
ncbi:MAG: outer membrane beta-barrel domain-containing protein [Deltaproteobacteria bacterium]|nr:outer membrane beta-barrel domain-containing protein [Deltaproteobacteria bacterium]